MGYISGTFAATVNHPLLRPNVWISSRLRGFFGRLVILVSLLHPSNVHVEQFSGGAQGCWTCIHRGVALRSHFSFGLFSYAAFLGARRSSDEEPLRKTGFKMMDLIRAA